MRRRSARGLTAVAIVVMSALALSLLPGADADARPRVSRAKARAAAPAPAVLPAALKMPLPSRRPAQAASSEAPAVSILAPTAAASPAVPLPEKPVDAAAVRAREVLDRHCARCHQTGRLTGRVTADAGFGNILELDEIARNPALVTPGEPDASVLYQQMIGRQMPVDVLRDGQPGDAPTFAEIEAVRLWIAGLKPPDACNDRKFVTADDLSGLMQAWLAQAGPQRAAATRFVSLAHLANACAGPAAMAAYRQGVVRLLNGLSWSDQPAVVETLGDDLALLALDLQDLGWTGDHWDALTAQAPQGALTAPEAVTSATGARTPVVAADWLADRAMQPEMYARLLGLPPTLDDLAKILGFDFDDRREDRVVRRGVAIAGTLTGGPRVIERYPTRRRSLWVSHDFPPDTDPTTVLDQPLLPWAAAGNPDGKAPKAEGARVLFTLPNGWPAFALFDRDGQRRDRLATVPAPPADEKPDAGQTSKSARHAAPFSNGGGCLACHAGGAQPFDDALSPHLASDTYAGDKVTHDIARQIVFSRAELTQFVADDRFDISKALTQAGVDPATSIAGLDHVSGLAARYRRDVDLEVAAAELLLDMTELRGKLAALGGQFRPLALKLSYQTLTRAEFEALQRGLSASNRTASALPEGPRTGTIVPAAAASRHRLSLWPETFDQRVGDKVALNVTTTRACHLTLVNIDDGGKATVLFPNAFDRDNLIKPGEVRRVPEGDAIYQFVFKEEATERFVAICEEGEPVPAGVRHDLTHQNFTVLGEWPKFLAAAHKAAREARVPLDNGDDIDRRRRGEPKPRPAPPTDPWQARAAIKITVGR